jgi:hypothetical protein
VNQSDASTVEIAADITCVLSSVRLVPHRPARAPALGPSNSGLRNCAQVTSPTKKIERPSW